MNVFQIFTNSPLRNFSYVISFSNKDCYIIDPYSKEDILPICQKNSLSVLGIINTHEHHDHVQGNSEIVEELGCKVYSHTEIAEQIPGFTNPLSEGMNLSTTPNEDLLVVFTPGHTMAHICLLGKENGVSKFLMTGDTVFVAGIGHCKKGGNPVLLYDTITNHIQGLEDSIVIYPGHDYAQKNLNFTLRWEPSNQEAKLALAKAIELQNNGKFIDTSLEKEKAWNVFFRLDKVTNLPKELKTNKDKFLYLRKDRDQY